MNTFEVQLVLGLIALLTWGLGAGLWFMGAELGHTGVIALVIGFSGALVILVFGSLFLLGVSDAATWRLMGTGLRGVVAITGVVALLSFQGNPQRPEE